MKRIIPWAVGLITGLLTVGLFWLPGTAQANETPAFQKQVADDGPKHLDGDCTNIQAWYVNTDEWGGGPHADPKQGDRRPKVTANGLVFEKNQLVHHAADFYLSDKLQGGSYSASPKPSLNTFFSIEVMGDDGKYGTLRWDANHYGETGGWNLGGTDLWNASPLKLVTDSGRSKHVISFGVGYVNNPGDGTKTTVTTVAFAENKYDLTCVSPTPSSSASSTKPTSSKPTKSSSAPAGGALPSGNNTSSGALAITGPSAPKVAIVAGLILAVGVGALVATRRRRAKFEA